MQTSKIVSWDTYAQKYDMLLTYNPFYQQLHKEVMEQVSQWQIESGDLIADIGAGTGNYSLAVASYFTQATVLHIDSDEGMNARSAEKKSLEPLLNHRILSMGVDEVQLEPGSLKALISIHALYTFPDPKKVLQDMFNWLEPGGKAVLVDAGRIVQVLDWQIAIGWHLLRHHGWRKTLQILQEGKEVSRQNAYIRDMQRQGIFWTHTHEEFCEAVSQTGFKILKSRTCFRGVSDFLVVEKN